LVKNYLSIYINKPEKLKDIVCFYISSNNATQFVRLAHIRKQYGLALWKYFNERDVMYWAFNAKSANQFVKNVHIRREYGLKLYKALKLCIHSVTLGLKPKDRYLVLEKVEKRKQTEEMKKRKTDYVRFTLKGLVRRNDNHECVAYIHFYLYSKADFYFDELNDEIDFQQKIDREHKYLNEYYDDYGLTVGYEYVTEDDIEPRKLVTKVEQISDVFDIMRGAVRCDERKGRVFDVELD